jgi:hypothetical protein
MNAPVMRFCGDHGSGLNRESLCFDGPEMVLDSFRYLSCFLVRFCKPMIRSQRYYTVGYIVLRETAKRSNEYARIGLAEREEYLYNSEWWGDYPKAVIKSCWAEMGALCRPFKSLLYKLR